MTPLRLRILGALALQPMTCAFLGRCLGYTGKRGCDIVWASLVRLEMAGKVSRRGRAYHLKTQSTRRKQCS